MDGHGLNRRQFLSMGSLVAGALVVTNVLPPLRNVAAEGLPRWSDPVTWKGRVPARGARVVLDKAVLLDVDVELGGLTITSTGALHFERTASRTVTSRGNVVIEGLLQMRPASASVEHVLRFAGVDEKRFVGGGMEVLESDVGLWCKGDGVLDLAGTPRLAWGRTLGAVPAGATSLTLLTDPVGWQVGDELVIVPSVRPDTKNHHLAYDLATITAVSGRTITLATRMVHEHPSVEVGPGMRLGPEVLNLTRNVRVEGTPDGRAHMWLHPARPQHLSYFAMRWLGPRQVEGKYTKSVFGRYGFHMHMGGEAVRGSQIVGAVARDLGGHSFVAHSSNGVTFTSCVSHDTLDAAYWWDGRPEPGSPAAESKDVRYDHCVASLVKVDPHFRGYRLAGFELRSGEGNAAHHCVAVGVHGNRDAAGFNWPESAQVGVWDFDGCVSHNNRRHGVFVWQNTPNAHVVDNFVCFHNGGSGISHGAYRNSYQYKNAYLYGNAEGALALHAHSRSTVDGLRFTGLHCDSAGLSPHAVRLQKHTLEPGGATIFAACTFVGQTGPAVAAVYDGTNGETTRELLDLVDCVSSTPLLRLRDDSVASSVVRVQDSGGALAARPKGQPGQFRENWNAMVADIGLFSSVKAVPARPFTLASGAVVPRTEQPPAPTLPDGVALGAPRHPHYRMGGVEAHLIHDASGMFLNLINRTNHTCVVDVTFNGRRAARHQAPPGQVSVKLPDPDGEGTLEASCHGARFHWYVYPQG